MPLLVVASSRQHHSGVQFPLIVGLSPRAKIVWFNRPLERGTHCLILDREKIELLIGPVKEARVFLTEQWPPEPPLRMSQEEYLAQITEALKQVKQSDDVDIEEIQRRIDEQYALIEEMQQWLDRQLKN
jgi:hypothetical protein